MVSESVDWTRSWTSFHDHKCHSNRLIMLMDVYVQDFGCWNSKIVKADDEEVPRAVGLNVEVGWHSRAHHDASDDFLLRQCCRPPYSGQTVYYCFFLLNQDDSAVERLSFEQAICGVNIGKYYDMEKRKNDVYLLFFQLVLDNREAIIKRERFFDDLKKCLFKLCDIRC